MAIYVVDNLIVGHPKAIEDIIEILKRNGFVVKVEDDLNEIFPVKLDSIPRCQRQG